jgi:cytosine/adenosine deaminase-related metal-dependent hydrolase
MIRNNVTRRQFVKSAAGLAAVSATARPAFSAQGKKTVGPLPPRGEFIIRDAYVMTMDPQLGDIAGGDVHVKNGAIIEVGKSIKAPGAAALDGHHMIVLPGMVETHWHMWNTLLRSFAGEKPDQGYFPTAATMGAVMTAEDNYHGVRLAACEALNSGMTTVHNYCHNLRSKDHAVADVRGLQEAGLRARWSYGWPQGLPDTQICDLAGLEEMHRNWASYSNDGLISLGFAWRGMYRAGLLPAEVYRKEIETARKLGIPISSHIGSAEIAAKGQIEAHAKEGLLGKDLQIIHALSATPAEIGMIAKSGAVISVSPDTELRIGYGFTKVSEFRNAGIPLGVSIDSTALAGDANLFDSLKMIRYIENARAHDEFKMTARRALELGTIDGARSLGIEDRVGSLKPGKRADVIMISTLHPNMAVFTDPAHLVVEATQASNVDTVVVDGRILKRGGKMVAMPVDQILAEASASFDGIRKRANWR